MNHDKQVAHDWYKGHRYVAVGGHVRLIDNQYESRPLSTCAITTEIAVRGYGPPQRIETAHNLLE